MNELNYYLGGLASLLENSTEKDHIKTVFASTSVFMDVLPEKSSTKQEEFLMLADLGATGKDSYAGTTATRTGTSTASPSTHF